MKHRASRPRPGLEKDLWFLLVIAALMGLSFLSVFIFLPH